MFIDTKKRKYLFKCEDCSLILSVDFDEEEEFEKVNDDKMILQCPCEGECKILRD